MPNILSLPLEVFEAIVGAVSFVDLPHFLQTSKQIKVFKTTLVTIPNLIHHSLLFKQRDIIGDSR